MKLDIIRGVRQRNAAPISVAGGPTRRKESTCLRMKLASFSMLRMRFSHKRYSRGTCPSRRLRTSP